MSDVGIRPLKGKVIAEIIDRGERKSAGGVVLLSDDGKDAGIRPRWFKVVAVHEDTKDFGVGDYVLVEHGRWTREFKTKSQGMGLCALEEDRIMLVSDECPSELA